MNGISTVVRSAHRPMILTQSNFSTTEASDTLALGVVSICVALRCVALFRVSNHPHSLALACNRSH